MMVHRLRNLSVAFPDFLPYAFLRGCKIARSDDLLTEDIERFPYE